MQPRPDARIREHHVSNNGHNVSLIGVKGLQVHGRCMKSEESVCKLSYLRTVFRE